MKILFLDMSLNGFVKELGGNRVEGELIQTFFYSVLFSAIVAIVISFIMKSANIFGNYGFYIILGIITYSLLALTLKQVRAYRQFNCMSGMMIGMTTGMIAGFLPAYYIGATNGMFAGGMFGMIVGILFGVWNGKCCGVMGVMEGVMAGFMGGWMGAMTSVMLLNDHLNIATIFISIVAWTIMIMLNYMIYFEMREADKQGKSGHMASIAFSAILTLITVLLMVFGPKSLLFG